MAGDWIKMRIALADDPAVIAMAERLGEDEFTVVGRLHHFWGWLDVQSRDGHAAGVTKRWIDRYCRRDGFADALVTVGWLEVDEDGIKVPNFDRHNGQTAKDRASATLRKKKQRLVTEEDGHVSRSDRDKNATREEKRREEVKEPPNPPSADADVGQKGGEPETKKRERKPRTSLKTFLHACKQNGLKPVTTYKPLMEYVGKVSLPAEFLELAWDVFRREHTDGGANEKRLQADWQRHFYNYVTKGYYRLWVCKPDGSFELTTVGQQNRKFLEAA